MAQNVTVAGASYSAVPSVKLPKTGGGTASFFDLSDTTALAADVASGKYFYLASGARTQGTARPYIVEGGQFKPSSDIARPTINFSKTYSIRPFFAMVMDADSASSLTSANSCLWCGIANWYDVFSDYYKTNSSTMVYARVQYTYKTSSGGTAGGYDITNTSSSSSTSDMGYYLTTSKFIPYLGSTSRYFRSNRYYNWVAVFRYDA